MLKITHDTGSAPIPKEGLLDATKRFLLHSDSNKDLVLIENINSLKFGSSDLLFINEAKTNLTVTKLNNRENTEKFVISSISYFFWLAECIAAGKVLFNGNIGLDMYLFSPEFSTAICYLVDNLAPELPIHLVKYRIIDVEDLDRPAIHFQRLNFNDPIQGPTQDELEKDSLVGQDVITQKKEGSMPIEISAQELSEFRRLKQHYLD
jgi:hypothetical protein